MSSSSDLIFALHGQLVRLIADVTGVHYEGLEQAARKLRCLSSSQRRRLAHLDHACHVTRHITSVRSQQFLDDIRKSLQAEARSAVLDPLQAHDPWAGIRLPKPSSSLCVGGDDPWSSWTSGSMTWRDSGSSSACERFNIAMDDGCVEGDGSDSACGDEISDEFLERFVPKADDNKDEKNAISKTMEVGKGIDSDIEMGIGEGMCLEMSKDNDRSKSMDMSSGLDKVKDMDMGNGMDDDIDKGMDDDMVFDKGMKIQKILAERFRAYLKDSLVVKPTQLTPAALIGEEATHDRSCLDDGSMPNIPTFPSPSTNVDEMD